MRLMFEVADPVEEMHTMTKFEGKVSQIDVKGLLAEDEDLLRTLMRTALQEVFLRRGRRARRRGRGRRGFSAASRAFRHRRQLGRPAPGRGGGVGHSREPIELAGLPH